MAVVLKRNPKYKDLIKIVGKKLGLILILMSIPI
jgi:hypothetical protein